MDFSDPPQRARAESIIPMINVVFLLLIFFLMTAQIAPPEPFEVMPPEADADNPAEAELVLYIDAAGRLGFGENTGEEAVLTALAEQVAAACEGQRCEVTQLLSIRADAETPASVLAALLPKLATAGFDAAQIVTALR